MPRKFALLLAVSTLAGAALAQTAAKIDPAKPFDPLPVDMSKIETAGLSVVTGFDRERLPELAARCEAIVADPGPFAAPVVKFCKSVPGWMPYDFGNYR